MSSKKSDDNVPPENDLDGMREIEDRVKRMLDPSEPDPEPQKPAFEVIKDNDSEPSSAPEVKDAPTKLPKSIEIKMHDEAAEESAAKPAARKTKSKKTAIEETPAPAAEKTSKPKSIAVIHSDGEESADAEKTPEAEEPANEPEPADDGKKQTSAEGDEVPEGSEETPALDEQGSEETEETSAEPEGEPETKASEATEGLPAETEAEPEPEPKPPVPETDSDAKPQPDEIAEDEKTAEAVDDIARKESDKLLEAEDKEIAKAFEEKKPSHIARIKTFFAAWWQNRAARRVTIAVVVLGIVTTLTVPQSRYFVLNNVGVRVGASVKVLDESTRQPLKNVRISLRGQSVKTDDEGKATLKDLKLGSTELQIEKRAFATIKQNITLGWGSNPLGDKSLTPIGDQYSIQVNDWLSSKPIHKVEAVSGEASAFSDEEGKIKLTIDKSTEGPVDISIVGEGLRTEKLTFDEEYKSERSVQMVAGRKHVFITKRSGKFDVYKIDVDGQNEELVLAGTGSERDDMVLLSHPSKEFVALVSTRGDARNGDGFLLSKLTLIDLSDNSTVEVAQSERVQIVDWAGDKLIFVRIAAGTSAGNPKRHRLMSYDLDSFESKEIASSNYFNDVIMARGSLYFAPSSVYQSGAVALFKVNPDGSNRQTILDKETWNILRTAYHTLTLSVGQDWYEYDIGKNSSKKLEGEPANLRSRSYADSPDGKKSLWVDQRDGKGVLLAYDLDKNEDDQIHERNGLNTPIRWLNGNTVVFRNTDQETADYAVSLDGGEPKKIRDVTNTASVDSWYYY